MNYIVTKPTKSKGIAILLVLIFGPIGLFYASIRAGIIMTILPIIVLGIITVSLISGNAMFLLGSLGVAFAFGIFYWIICLIWTVNAVDIYNEKIERGAFTHQNQPFNSQYDNYQNKNLISSENESGKNKEFREWFKNNPTKGINDYFREVGNPISQKASTEMNVYNDDKIDISFIIYSLICFLILTCMVLMYDTDDKTYNLINIFRFF